MKKLLLTTVALMAFGLTAPASAADMAVKAPPPPVVPPVYNWTGFYIGAHVGGAWTDTNWFYPCSATNLLIASPCNLAQGGHSASSWLAGGQVGFNYQVGRFVWGVEADFSATRMEGRNLDAAFPPKNFFIAGRTSSALRRPAWAWPGTGCCFMPKVASLGRTTITG
jgi:outer membrane immunogenic protein